MHLSMHNWMRPEPIDITAGRLARSGYQSIEISGDPERYPPERVMPVLESYSLRCWGVVTRMVGSRSLIAADEAQRASTVAYVKDCITMAKELGGSMVAIVPSPIGKVEPEASADEEWQWAVEGLRDIYAHSQAAGVVLAIEPLSRYATYFINRAEQAMALAEAVGAECGVCLDMFHVNIEERDPYAAIRRVGEKLVNVDVADNNRMPAGMGSYDWPHVVATLTEIGYDGALSAEFIVPIDRIPSGKMPTESEAALGGAGEEPMEHFIVQGSADMPEVTYSRLVERNAEVLLPLIR